jgi:glycosyltransferase involved in cell wall biosynthesis
MRAGQFTDSYLPIVNGVSTFIHVFTGALERLGHEPTVFTFGRARQPHSARRVIRSPGLPLGRSGFYVAPTYSRRAWSIARSMDVLHAHHPFVAGPLAARLRRQLNKPLVFTNHTRYDYYAGVYLPFLPRRQAIGLLGAWMRRFVRHCDLIIAVSPAAHTMLKALGVEAPIEIIYNGIDLERFARAAPEPRASLGLPPDAFVLMYVGRLGVEKNVDTLLEGYAITRRSVPQAILALVGDGPHTPRLRECVSQLGLADGVRFLGMHAYDQIPSILGAADAFVTASITEGHPMTIIEALAAGQPVLAFDVSGIRETVIDGENGLLAPVNVQSLARNMMRVATDARLRARLSGGARRTATRYDIESTAQHIVEYYEYLIRERHNTVAR